MLLLCGGLVSAQSLKPTQKFKIAIDEPSDIAYCTESNSCFVVSDNGQLYETSTEGKLVRKANLLATDLEGVFVRGEHVYAVDERLRKIYKLDRQTLTVKGVFTIPYYGPRNSGYEGMTFNPVKNCFVLVIEKNSPTILELDTQFRVINETVVKVQDISAVTFQNGKLILLSDEEQAVLVLNPETYSIEKRFKIPVVNPEGISFLPDDRMMVLSDGMNKLFYFNPLF